MNLLREDRPPDRAPGAEEPDAKPDSGAAPHAEGVVRCAACGHVLALERDRIAPDGSHAHTFVNPSGVEFTIRCFAGAAGCVGWGEASSFWSWFPGHGWRIALCGGCHAHVGWSFSSLTADTQAFHGLIVDRLG